MLIKSNNTPSLSYTWFWDSTTRHWNFVLSIVKSLLLFCSFKTMVIRITFTMCSESVPIRITDYLAASNDCKYLLIVSRALNELVYWDGNFNANCIHIQKPFRRVVPLCLWHFGGIESLNYLPHPGSHDRVYCF